MTDKKFGEENDVKGASKLPYEGQETVPENSETDGKVMAISMVATCAFLLTSAVVVSFVVIPLTDCFGQCVNTDPSKSNSVRIPFKPKDTAPVSPKF